MAKITLTLSDNVYERMKDLTANRTPEEVQSMMQEWFDWIAELPQGYLLDLDTQVETYLDKFDEYEDGYRKH